MADDITDKYFELLESLVDSAGKHASADCQLIVRAVAIQTRALVFAQQSAQHEVSKRLLSVEEQILEFRKTLLELNGRP